MAIPEVIPPPVQIPPPPGWLIRPATKIGSGHSNIEWQNGIPVRLTVKYQAIVAIPSHLQTSQDRIDWYHNNIESAKATGNDLFYGVPKPLTPHPTLGMTDGKANGYMIVTGHTVTAEGFVASCTGELVVDITVEYTTPAPASGTGWGKQQTDGGKVKVPLGSWGVEVGWTTSGLTGFDWSGKLIETKAGEAVNVMVNIATYTLTRSRLAEAVIIEPPTINKSEYTVNGLGLKIERHCGLRVITYVGNTDTDTYKKYPYVEITQIIYIPPAYSTSAQSQIQGNIANAGTGEGSGEFIGSYDVVVLHQGHREICDDGKIRSIGTADRFSGYRGILPTMLALDKDGKAIRSWDKTSGKINATYLQFQVYEDSVWK